MKYLLDTSAVLVVVLGQPGADRVLELLENEQSTVAASVLTKAELWARLKSVGREEDFPQQWDSLRTLFAAVLPVEESVVNMALELRRVCPERLPLVDALIAATAAAHQCLLVHRDQHFRHIPRNLLPQIDLANGP